MDTALFDYQLPAKNIAQKPTPRRSMSRLMVIDRRSGEVSHHRFREFPEIIGREWVLFRNNARVLKARLTGLRQSGGRAECLLLEQADQDLKWWCLIKPGRKLGAGSKFGLADEYEARITGKDRDGRTLIEFKPSKPGESVIQLAERIGKAPLPPYIRRTENDRLQTLDEARYQTVYAEKGRAIAVAAPTAGLHFTQEVLRRIKRQGNATYDITLHVGLGTFRPLQSRRVEDHHMHEERYEISPRAASAIAASNQDERLAIGTTVLRALEDYVHRKAGSSDRPSSGFDGNTGIFIYPPAHFASAGHLLTNFHLPKSTLICLVAAFLTPDSCEGIKWLKELYAEAIGMHYRFYSYGDAMLII